MGSNGKRRPEIDGPDCDIVALIPALRAFARSFYRDPVDADDLVQAVLLKGIARIHLFKPGTHLKSWLFTIMRNTFYTRAKKARRESPGANDCVSTLLGSCPGSQEWSVRGRELREALQRLSKPQRDVITLIGVLGFSYEEAAEICGCEVGTVRSRLSRGRQQLVREMGETSAEDIFTASG
jgi:RNA polymerase sigma factor (sigma-70 family)